MPSTSNDAVELPNELEDELLAYCALLPLNCNLSPEFTVIVGADEPVFDVIDAHSLLFNLYSIVLVTELSDAAQLIVPADKMLNVKYSVE